MSNESENKNENESEKERIPGYCALCRREEIELYDDCVGYDEPELHRQACLDAGCLHPAFYLTG